MNQLKNKLLSEFYKVTPGKSGGICTLYCSNCIFLTIYINIQYVCVESERCISFLTRAAFQLRSEIRLIYFLENTSCDQ